MQRICSFPDCTKPLIAKGLCDQHYRRLRRHGDPAKVLPVGAQKGHKHGFQPGNPSRPGPRPTTSYKSVHNQLNRKRGRASAKKCDICGGKADEWAYTNGDPNERVGTSGGYRVHFSVDIYNFYIPLCRSCHNEFDRSHREAALRA